MRGSSRNIRALTRPGPRVRAPGANAVASLPARIAVSRSEETLDTEPNRFIAFALRRWRELALNVQTLLAAQGQITGPISRGLDAAAEVIAVIDRTLSAPMFRSVGRLGSFPTANQVLQKRAGYRELLRTFVLTETGRTACSRLGSGRRVCRQPAQRRDPVRVLGVSAAREERRSRLRRRPLSPRDGALERRDEHRLSTRDAAAG